MKVKLRSSKLYIVLVVLFVLCISAKPLKEEELKPLVQAFLEKALPGRGSSLTWKGSYYDKDLGLYVVALLTEGQRQVLLYVDRSGKYVFIGRIYNASTGEELTQKHLKSFPIISPPREVGSQGLDLIGPPLGRGESAIIISSPNCPHCRQVMLKVIEKASSGKICLYYKGIPLGQDREIEELIECLRQTKPELFWDFVKKAYSEEKEKALSWLRSTLKEDPYKGCDRRKANSALQGNWEEVKSKLGLEGIPALVLKGKVFEGVSQIEKALKGL